MYVAITRARKRLYLSFSQTRMLHGQTRYNVKSRFLDELPEAALRWITPRNQGFGSGFARQYSEAWSRGSGLHSIVGTGRVPAFGADPKPEAGGDARPALRPGRVPHQVRRGRDHHPRRQRRRRARPGQLRPPRPEVARAQRRQADACRLSGPGGRDSCHDPACPCEGATMAAAIPSPARRALAAALVLAAAGCASSPQLAAQWTDPQLGPQSAFLRGSRVLVACDVADLTVRQLCQDRVAAEVTARGATPLFPGPDTLIATDRSIDGQLLAAARSADAKALMVLTLTPAVTDVSPGWSVGIGGFGYSAQQLGRRRRDRAGRRRPGDHGLCRQRPHHRRRQRPAGVVGERQHGAVVGARRAARRAVEDRVRRGRQVRPVLKRRGGGPRRGSGVVRAGPAGVDDEACRGGDAAGRIERPVDRLQAHVHLLRVELDAAGSRAGRSGRSGRAD